MLETQIVSVSLAQGMDTKTDPKQVTSEYLLIQNAIYKTLEEIELRAGFSALSKTTYTIGVAGTITAGYGLGALNSALAIHDGTNVWSRTGDTTQWTYAGQKRSVQVSSTGVGSPSSAYLTSTGYARASNGVELYVWLDRTSKVRTNNDLTGTAYFLAYDTNNKVTVYQPAGIVTGVLAVGVTSIRADAVGTDFFITTSNGTAIKIYKQPASAPLFTSASSTSVDAAAGVNFLDTCASSSAVYILGSKVYRVDASTLAVTSSAASTYGTVPNAGINWDAAQSNVWITNISGTNVQAAVLSSSLSVVKALTTVSTIGGTATGGALSLYVNNNVAYAIVPVNAFNVQQILSITLSGGSFTTLASSLASNSQSCSKPTVGSGGYLYYIGIFTSNNQLATSPTLATVFNPTQPTTFLLKVDTTLIGSTQVTPSVAARALSLETGIPYGIATQASNTTLLFYAPNSITQLSSTQWVFPNLKTTQDVVGVFSSAIAPSSIVVKSQFDFNVKIRRGTIANNIQATGGYLSQYDTAQEAENNFHLFPEITALAQSPQAFAVPNGTYLYSGVFRWVDAQGQIHRSAPAVPASITVSGGPARVDISVTGTSLTDKYTYYLDLYRSQASGTVLYFLKTLVYGQTGALLGGTATDSNSSDQVSTLELYTTGGEVENVTPPATSFVTDFKNRLFLIPSENPYTLWYTKQVITNFPAEFSDLFTINLEPRGGAATALATLDDKLIILKKTALFYMVGDGPAPSGVNNDFSYPQIIPSDSGCTEPDSVVSFPGGVIFKGAKGIYLLDRALQISYIGAPVEAYNGYSITSAILDYNSQLIRFTLSNGTGLAYDYFVKKWTVFTNISAVDAVVADGTYSYLQSDGTVQQETLGSYTDNGTAISMSFTTGWLSFAKIQGFQRIKKLLLLGKNNSGSTVAVSFAYDFDSTVSQTVSISNSAVTDPWQYQVSPARQKCEAMQLGITITPTGTAGRALSLSGIALEVGVKRGTQRVPASRSVG